MIFLGILIGIVVTFVFLQLIKVISRVCSIISERKERERCRYEDMFNDIRDLKERVEEFDKEIYKMLDRVITIEATYERRV